MMSMDDLKDFTWGKVEAIHEIGPYSFVEYSPIHQHQFDKLFGVYVDGRDCCTSAVTLEEAMIEAIAIKRHGMADAYGERYAKHACRLLGLIPRN